MSRFINYAMVMSGIGVLFYLSGLIDSNPFLDLLLQPQNMSSGQFYTTIILGVLGGVGAIVVGYFTKDLVSAIMAPITVYLTTLLWNFISVFNRLKAENEILAVLFLSSLLLGFFLTMIDWWRSNA